MTMTAALPGELYYRHSGRFDATRTPLAVALALLTAVGCGTVYAYLDLYIPVVGWITFVLTGGTAFVVGLAAGRLLKWARLRNVPMGLATGVLIGAVLILASWEAWIYAILQRAADPQQGLVAPSPWEVLTDPATVWTCILAINEKGAWSLKDLTPTGPALWGIWLVEAGCLVGIPLWQIRKSLSAVPFCEACLKWGSVKPLVNLKPVTVGKAELKQRLESKDFSVITSAGESRPEAMLFWTVSLQGCAGCDNTQTLCVDETTLSYSKKGQLQKTSKPVITRLRLTPEETVGVAMAVSQLRAAVAGEALEQAATRPAKDGDDTAALQALEAATSPPPPAPPLT